MSSNFQGEGTVTYTYSGDQKRRSRSVSGGAMTKYRVDQGFGVVNEENSGGTLLSTYIHHPGRQIGTVLATSEGSTASGGTWNYYFQDAIGSTRSLWDEDGDRLGKYDYTPFGGKYGNTGEEITRKFTGHDWDNEARLYHTAYRQYSPDTGRWLTRDPLGMVDGPNVYAYVVNNPVTMVDLSGGFTLSGLALSTGRYSSMAGTALRFASPLMRFGKAGGAMARWAIGVMWFDIASDMTLEYLGWTDPDLFVNRKCDAWAGVIYLFATNSASVVAELIGVIAMWSGVDSVTLGAVAASVYASVSMGFDSNDASNMLGAEIADCQSAIADAIERASTVRMGVAYKVTNCP